MLDFQNTNIRTSCRHFIINRIRTLQLHGHQAARTDLSSDARHIAGHADILAAEFMNNITVQDSGFVTRATFLDAFDQSTSSLPPNETACFGVSVSKFTPIFGMLRTSPRAWRCLACIKALTTSLRSGLFPTEIFNQEELGRIGTVITLHEMTGTSFKPQDTQIIRGLYQQCAYLG